MTRGALAEPRVEAPAAERRGGRLRALLIRLVVGVLVAWVGYGGVAGVIARGDLLSARQHGVDGRDALLARDPAAALGQFGAARVVFARAERRLSGPAMIPLHGLPMVGSNLRAMAVMAAAGEAMAGAGEHVADAIAGLPGGVGALAPRNGTVPIDALHELARPLGHAHGLVSEAERLAGTLPEGGLLGPVADARAELLPVVNGAATAVATASTLVEVMPAFLGAQEPKRYFLGAANPAELRGTGGLIGAYSILTVDRGRLDLGGFASIHDLEGRSVDEIAAPHADYAARYDRYGGAGFWQNINMTPDFPSAAAAIETLYADVTGEAVDGTIVVAPQMFAGLLALTGSTEVPGVGTVDAEGVVPLVANEAYGRLTDPEQRKQLLGAVAASALDRFLRGEATGSPLEVMEVLAEAAAGRHLLLHSVDERVQDAFEDVELGGALGGGEGDYLAAVVNNAAANKTDYYADRTVEYTIDLEAGGGGRALAAVELVNEAPTEGLPDYVIGPYVRGASAGDNRSLLSIYCAPGCEREAFRRSRGEGPLREETELGHPVFTTMVPLPSGAAERVELEWSLRDVWVAVGDGGRYRLTVQGQPTVRPTTFALDVRVPDGMVVTAASDGLEVEGDRARGQGVLVGTQSFDISFVRP